MKYLALAGLLVGSICTCAQKPVIKVEDLDKWYEMRDPLISDNGEYVAYNIYNQPVDENTEVVRSINGTWQKKIVNAHECQFTPDSKYFLSKSSDEYLTINLLGTGHEEKISNVSKHSVFNHYGRPWVAYLKNKDGELVFRSLKRENTIVYKGVKDFYLSNDGNHALIISKIDSVSYALSEINLLNNTIVQIYKGSEPQNLIFDAGNRQVLFLCRTEAKSGAGNSTKKNIWYYNPTRQKVALNISPAMEIDKELHFERFIKFSKDGSFAFCQLSVNRDLNRELSNNVVTVWSFTDSRLKSDKDGAPAGCIALFYVVENKIIQIQQKTDSYIDIEGNEDRQLLYSRQANDAEWNWNEKAIPSRILLDLKTGWRKKMTEDRDRNSFSYVLSPSGGEIIYYNSDQKAYFCLNVYSGVRRNITSNIHTIWTSFEQGDTPFSDYVNYPLAGFSSDGRFVYLYDQNDIYRADLSAKESTICLTNYYGKKSGIVFRLAFPPDRWQGNKIILTAFDRNTKEDGFWELDVRKPGVLKMLTMGPVIYTGPDESGYYTRFLNMPIRAKNVSVFLVTKMDAAHSPNLYVTKNFSSFKAVSEVFPERQYNWLTTKLVNFKTLDGREAQGILYKPENFDSTKKYPVIFHYYEKISECLNLYVKPDLCFGRMNIPYFVSNGYLVFTPDINFIVGHPGFSSFNTLMGAASELSKLDYVDSTKMGLQGHSFGGFQTNFIIAHTTRFAAASSAAGFTNFVSAYGSIIGTGFSRQGQYELFRDRIGASLWKRPDLYLENSPVLLIDKIGTPLLLMHNNDDKDVLVGQGIEFFTGLRRLGKVSYLLQYPKYGHIVFGEAAKDYTRKMHGFFDYYLMGKELPNWMTTEQVKILDFVPSSGNN